MISLVDMPQAKHLEEEAKEKLLNKRHYERMRRLLGPGFQETRRSIDARRRREQRNAAKQQAKRAHEGSSGAAPSKRMMVAAPQDYGGYRY